MDNEVEPKKPRKAAKPKAPKPPITLEEAQSKLLAKLQQVGAKGSGAPYTKTKPADIPVYEEAIAALAAGPTPELFVDRRTAKPKYFLWAVRPMLPSAQTVARTLLARIEAAHPLIETLAKLKSSTPTKERAFVAAAIEHLREQGDLVALQFASGKTVQTLYASAGKLREELAHGPAAVQTAVTERPMPTASWTPERVREVYEAHVRQTGFRAMAITTLARIASASLPEFKDWLRAENQAGRVVLSVGDWSLADEDERRGVIELHGQRFLQVRFL